MTLEQWAYLGQIVAAAAVVGSLVYLGMQVRQSNALSRAQTRQSMMELSQEQILINVADPKLWTLLLSEEPLEGDEKVRVNLFLTAVMRQREYEWFAHRDGVIDAEMFEAYSGVIAILLGTERNRRWWKIRAEIKEFDPQFMAFVDDVLEKAPISNYQNLIDRWT